MEKQRISLLIAGLFLSVMMLPVIAADSSVPEHTITVDWGAVEWGTEEEGGLEQRHSYRFEFDDALNSTVSEFSANVSHFDSEGSLLNESNYSVAEMEFVNDRILRLDMPDQLSFGDSINIETFWDGASSGVSRNIQATVWNQPLADHSVTITTDWNLNHSYEDENGSQHYLLLFNGRGWQERQGDILHAWELGDGIVTINEVGENETTWINLTLDEIWRNETTVDGVLQAQYFNAQGWGDLVVEFSDDEMDSMRVTAAVSNAQFNRSTVDGIISEGTKLEATGYLNASNEDEDGELWMNGTVSILYFERYEVDGVIEYDLVQFEGYADMQMVDGENRFDIDISEIAMYEEWEDGERIGQRNSIRGDGTFGFKSDDDDGDITINGTVYDLRDTSVNGEKTDQYFHMDGTFTGDVDGTFGAITSIETSGEWQNHNGTDYPVNVILEETWFNLTGSGGFGFEGAGQNHNRSWNYEVPYIDWDNTTIYRKWESTGFDNDEGDEYPEDSPLPSPPTPPETEDGLGEVNLSRETGLSPVSLQPGDMVSLLGSDLVKLDIVASATTTSTKDGRVFDVTQWAGFYYNEEGTLSDGTAIGEVINKGPLSGLISSVQRQLTVPAVNDEDAVFTEVQVLERISYPSVVSEGENSAPSLETISLRSSLVNERGTSTYLEVSILDPDWNTISVVANLSSLGLGTVQLGDEGLDGDLTIHDDVWTTQISVPGIEHGDLPVSVTVTDTWGATDSMNGTLEVFNQAPRLSEWEHAPSQAFRGEILIVNARVDDGNGVARVAVDMRDHGGDLHDLSLNIGNQKWTGEILVPEGMHPGEQALKVFMEDDDGASIIVTSTQSQDSHYLSGPDDEAIRIQIMNQGPILESPATTPDEIEQVEKDGDEKSYTVTVHVSDPDDIRWVKVKLGALAAIGQQDTFLLMYDNGENGDLTAGDGIYSLSFESRRGVPLGTHPITFKAEDDYGAEEYNDEFVIKVVEAQGETLDADQVFSFVDDPEVILWVIGILLFMAIPSAAVLALRKRKQNKENPWSGKQQDDDSWGNQ